MSIECPICGQPSSAKPEAADKKIRCSNCDTSFVIPGTNSGAGGHSTVGAGSTAHADAGASMKRGNGKADTSTGTVRACSTCKHPNPPEADYCYFDGTPLAGSERRRERSTPPDQFPRPYVFPSGRSCKDFKQFAEGCQREWKPACEQLMNGSMANFFAEIGRADLATAASGAAKCTDINQGLDYVLQCFPPNTVPPAKLRAATAKLDFGEVKDPRGCRMELRLGNQGIGILYGTIFTDAPWLNVGEKPGQRERVFEFVKGERIPVWIRPQFLQQHGKQRAEVTVESNEGTINIPAVATVHACALQPSRPDNVFASVVSPASAPVESADVAPADSLEDLGVGSLPTLEVAPRTRRRRQSSFLKTAIWGSLIAIALTASVLALFRFARFSNTTPVTPFAGVLPDQSVSLTLVQALDDEEIPSPLRDAVSGLLLEQQSALKTLNVEPGTAKLQKVLFIQTEQNTPYRVLVFDTPVSLGKPASTRYQPKKTKKAVDTIEDMLTPGAGWAVDAAGRLLFGQLDDVETAVERQAAGAEAPAFRRFGFRSRNLPENSPFWIVADVTRAQGVEIPLPFANAFDDAKVTGLTVAVDKKGFDAYLFARGEDMEALRSNYPQLKRQITRYLEGNLPKSANVEDTMESLKATVAGNSVHLRCELPSSFAVACAQSRTENLAKAIENEQTQFAKLLDKTMDLGNAAFKKKLFDQARQHYARAALLFPDNESVGKKLNEVNQLAFDQFMKNGEDLLGKEKYADAAKAFEQALTCLENNRAQQMLARAKEGMQAEAQFERALTDISTATAAKDLLKANLALETAAKLRPRDARLDKHRQAIADLRTQSAFADLYLKGNQALATLEFDAAKKHFEAALKLNPDMKECARRIQTLDNLFTIRATLKKGRELLRKKESEPALTEAAKVRTLLEAELKIEPTAELLKFEWQDAVRQTSMIYWGLVQIAQDASFVHESAARSTFASAKYEESSKHFRGAVDAIDASKKLLEELKAPALNVPAADIESRQKELQAQLDSYEKYMKKCVGQVHFEKGKELLRQAQLDIKSGQDFNERLPGVTKKLEQAILELRSAQGFPDINVAADIKTAEAAQVEVARMITPVEFPIKFQKLPAQWTVRPEGTTFKITKLTTWMRAAPAESTTYASPIQFIPNNFELKVRLAMLTPADKINNKNYASIPDPFSIVLQSKNADVWTLALGKDPDLPFQHSARIQYGKHSKNVDQLLPEEEPLTIRLRRRQNTMTLFFGDRRLGSYALSGEFHRVLVTLRNGRRRDGKIFAYSALEELSLRLTP